MIVSGISEWARRIRELRVQFGWSIINGITAMELREAEDSPAELSTAVMGPDDYMLLFAEQDMEAAYRWNVANEIRKSGGGMKERLLAYFRRNVSKPVTGEELRYIADGSEWARRIRELRTEDGWPIATKTSGRPDLPVGVYLLERDSPAKSHDRHIPDSVRGEVLRRDGYTCVSCKWRRELWNPADPRFLELHHKIKHAAGGDNTFQNLITLCNICHDEVHRLEEKT